jgi:hypothetical protein
MADISTDALVISDAEGHYYVVPRDVIEQARVDDDVKDEIDSALGIETQGFNAPHIGLGFGAVGALDFSRQQQLGGKLPQVGWPYYMPSLGMDPSDPAAR